MSSTTFADLMERAYDEARPMTAQLELTYKCNLLCSFCYNAPKERKELTAEQWIDAIDKLKAGGTFKMTLTGGEPFCHKDYFRIAGAVRERGLVLATYTNGVLLADRGRAERYAALAPFDTEISIHGSTAQVHDRLTGIRASFDKLLTALGHLSELGVKVTLKTPITKLNQAQLPEIEQIGARFGYKVTFDTNITPTDDGDLGPLSMSADKEFLVGFFVARMRSGAQGLGPRIIEKVKHNCAVGRTTVTIDPYGDVFPCVAWRRPLGNIVEIEDFGALWQGKNGTLNENLAYVRKVSVEVPQTTLATHEGGLFANFCPAVAEKETGSAYTFYSGARASGLTKMAAYNQFHKERGPEKSAEETLAPESGKA